MSYHTFGTGNATLIAFHGYGRTGEDFLVFEPDLGERFTIHAFDLPFHGNSPASSERADRPFSPRELGDFFTAFADRIGAKRTALMGYSLGGRVALSLLGTMPERISKTILIAPDGLRPRPWYRVLASSPWGRARYRSFIERPQRVHGIAHALHRTGLLHGQMHRFVIGQTDSHEKRRFLHDVWLSYRDIEPDLNEVVTRLRAHQIQLDLVFGELDPVISARPGRRIATRAPELIRVHVLPFGHRLLIPQVGKVIHHILEEHPSPR